jgi:hypothetical protein
LTRLNTPELSADGRKPQTAADLDGDAVGGLS